MSQGSLVTWPLEELTVLSTTPPSQLASLPKTPEVSPQLSSSEVSLSSAELPVRAPEPHNARTKRKRPASSPPARIPRVPPAILKHLQLMLDPGLYLQVQETLTTGRPPPIAISNLTTLESVCTAFRLRHPELTAEIEDGDFLLPSPAMSTSCWEITDAGIEDWLEKQLAETGVDIKSLLDSVVEPNSVLQSFIYLYRAGVERTKEAACRPLVDIILLTALSILSGAGETYQSYLASLSHSDEAIATSKQNTNSPSPKHQRKKTPNTFRRLKLFFEVDLRSSGVTSGTPYTGRVDWGIGLKTSGSQNSTTISNSFRSLLTIIEAKSPMSVNRAYIQALAYMGCIYRQRESVGARLDISTYGIATDGYQWQFLRLFPAGGSLSGQVSETAVYHIRRGGNLRMVLAHILFILVRGQECLTPHPSPEKSTKGGEGFLGEDDGAILFPARSATEEARLQVFLEAGNC
ncbi:hypothetical protein L211DRAFT_865540 [Terfezia boudieri ATCC MYA-4762]|uniref:Uncharacterized protein n=1 Tax=Terfezia boudieri ATCC MYA-4762 TaxID=1051890 RepID=A0A3N4M2Y4_9PEZI|nr:hypothetical protein L211DRAFT_865540 [Terfezia boudieri ATCC MYA-4762]